MAKKTATKEPESTPDSDELESTLESELGDALDADTEGGDAGGAESGDDAGGQSDSKPAAQSQQAAESEAVTQSLKDRLIAKGFQVEGDDDDAVINHLIRQQQQAKAVAPYASKVHDYLRDAEDYARYKAQRDYAIQQQQAAQQQPAQEDWYKRPEWDNAWLKYVDQTTGSLTPDTPPHLQQKILDFANWKAKVQDKFWEHPGEFLRPALEQIKREAVAEAQQAYQQLSYQQSTAQAIAKLSSDNPWLWQQSPDGQPIVNPVTNQPVFSEVGARVVGHARQIMAESNGQISQPRAMQLAIDSVFAGESRSYFSAQQAISPEDKNAAAKDKLLKKNTSGGKLAGRGGSVNGHRTQETAQNPKASTYEQLMTEFDRAGITEEELMRTN